MKTKKQYRLIVLLTLLLLSPMAQGQEFIKTIYLGPSYSVIVRDIEGDKWLVYDQYANGNTMENGFVKVYENSSSAELLILPSSINLIYDFEIFENEVYFCGENNNGEAVMGNLPLLNFPWTSVKIWTVPTMKVFYKLDVGKIDETLHVLMTGQAVLGSSHIVDAIPQTSTQWLFATSLASNNWSFDDVAITTANVVFSGRTFLGDSCSLAFFQNPGINSHIMQPGYFNYVNITRYSEIKLKATSPDHYAFMMNTSAGPLVGEGYGFSPVWQALLGNPVSYSSCRGMDIAYNPLSNRVDLLANGILGLTSCVFHPFSFSAPIIPTVYSGHDIANTWAYSLDGIGNATGRFIAAGIEDSQSKCLKLFRYKYNEWHDCLNELEREVRECWRWPGEKIDKIYYREDLIEAEQKDCSVDEILVNTNCPSK